MNEDFQYILSSNGWSSKHFDDKRHQAIDLAIQEYGVESVINALEWVKNNWESRSRTIALTCIEDMEYIHKNYDLKRNYKKEKINFESILESITIYQGLEKRIFNTMIGNMISGNLIPEKFIFNINHFNKTLNLNLKINDFLEVLEKIDLKTYGKFKKFKQKIILSNSTYNQSNTIKNYSLNDENTNLKKVFGLLCDLIETKKILTKEEFEIKKTEFCKQYYLPLFSNKEFKKYLTKNNANKICEKIFA